MTKQEKDKLREMAKDLLAAWPLNSSQGVSATQINALLDELDKKDEAYAKGFEDAKEAVDVELDGWLDYSEENLCNQREAPINQLVEEIQRVVYSITPKGNPNDQTA